MVESPKWGANASGSGDLGTHRAGAGGEDEQAENRPEVPGGGLRPSAARTGSPTSIASSPAAAPFPAPARIR